MSKKLRKKTQRVTLALLVFLCAVVLTNLHLLGDSTDTVCLVLYLIAYAIAGYDVVVKAARNIAHGQVFDENFLMGVATLGAFAIGEYPEGVAVILFYQVGEIFQDAAVGKSRKSISDMMDIAPEFATMVRDGVESQVDPSSVAVDETISVKPGERIPLDGIVLDGSSQLDTAALTGESVPRHVEKGDNVISGCINMTGLISVRVTKPYGESTVSRILDLVENASDKKARTENFITRFAKVYTPTVVILAVLLACVPPLLMGGSWAEWVQRGLTFLVVSCPCALVISVPLSFFGGIGGASRAGVLVKGSNYLELLSQADTIVFDKTGTLTNGTFSVVEVTPTDGTTRDSLIETAALAESYSDHPIAVSVRSAYGADPDKSRVTDVSEESGHGVHATVDGHAVLIGNDKLMVENHVDYQESSTVGTVLYVASDGTYLGSIVIADTPKADAAKAIADLKTAGVKRCIMLTGDREEVAASVASQLGLDEYHAELLPEDKVSWIEKLLAAEKGGKDKVAFVGDGINDAPVLMRSDVGIAMGAMGSDAAIEAADIVLMDDEPSKIATAISVSRKTLRIVWQNIIFAIGIKVIVLILAALGIANMWLAVFADVGVAIIAILNAMRCMRLAK